MYNQAMDYQERHAQARAVYERGLARVQNQPMPDGQAFPVGARVRIADDLGSAMRHFPSGRFATVVHTYAHAFGGDDVKSYCLDIDDIGQHSWYDEHQLTLVEEWPDTIDV